LNEIWKRYDRRLTDLSLKELVNFAEWMNRFLGYNPTIIGGWAVYLYNPRGLGSRDIDVLLPTWKIRDKVINVYMVNNEYELRERAFGVAEWVKLLEPGNPESESYIDVCTLQDKNLVHGRQTEIPWSIATKWQRSKRVEQGEIFIPEPESLLVLKAKAAWDRSYDIMKGGGDSFLRDKVRKDRFDILSLLSTCQMKQEIIDEIVSEYEFKACFKDALLRAISDQDVLRRHNFGDGEIENLKEKITRMTRSS